MRKTVPRSCHRHNLRKLEHRSARQWAAARASQAIPLAPGCLPRRATRRGARGIALDSSFLAPRRTLNVQDRRSPVPRLRGPSAARATRRVRARSGPRRVSPRAWRQRLPPAATVRAKEPFASDPSSQQAAHPPACSSQHLPQLLRDHQRELQKRLHQGCDEVGHGRVSLCARRRFNHRARSGQRFLKGRLLLMARAPGRRAPPPARPRGSPGRPVSLGDVMSQAETT